MAEFSYPWGVDATDAASADSRLYQAGWRELVGGNVPDGIVLDRAGGTLTTIPTSTPLYVSAPGTGTVISIAAGSAVVQGFLYDNTAAKTIDVATVGTQPSAGQSRTDSVVLKLDPTASPASTRLSVQLHAGTAATTGSQVAPTLTKSATGVWEVEIARVTRAASANVLQANITQTHPRSSNPVMSINAPGNPTKGQMWMDDDMSMWVWSGTAWVYNGGGTAPIASMKPQGSLATSSTVINCAGDGDNGNQAVNAAFGGNGNRLGAKTAGRFRYWATIRPNNTGASATPTQWSFRKNSGGVGTGGTGLEAMWLTAVQGTYVNLNFGGEVVLAAGDYIELFGFAGITGVTIDGNGGQGRITLQWVGTA